LGDARHVRTFGRDSLFGSVLERLRLVNAWRTATRFRATATVGLERLAEMPDAALVVVDPVPPGVWAALDESPLWHALPSVRDGRVIRLDAVNPFGALPAARRFAELLAGA
jgi:ABC-type Fe3+-hydroxamate transport system substrate-binding protein